VNPQFDAALLADTGGARAQDERQTVDATDSSSSRHAGHDARIVDGRYQTGSYAAEDHLHGADAEAGAPAEAGLGATWTQQQQQASPAGDARYPALDDGGRWGQYRYDIRRAILTCAQTLTRVSLIYRTEPTTEQWENRKKLKSKK